MSKNRFYRGPGRYAIVVGMKVLIGAQKGTRGPIVMTLKGLFDKELFLYRDDTGPGLL